MIEPSLDPPTDTLRRHRNGETVETSALVDHSGQGSTSGQRRAYVGGEREFEYLRAHTIVHGGGTVA
jgi:hypothetical protein